MKIFLLVLVLSTLSAAAWGQQSSGTNPTNRVAPTQSANSANDPVVLKSGKTELTRSEFETILNTLRAAQDAGDEPVDLRKLGENYAAMLALSQQALANHLDSSPEVQRQLAIDRTQILSNAEYARLLAAAKPTAAEVSEYYAAHASDYDQVQVRRLFIWKRLAGSQGTKGLSPEEAQALATKIEQTLAGGGDVKKLVAGNESVVLDIEPLTFPRGELPPYMEKPAFSMADGKWQVLEDKPDGLILLQVVKHERRPLSAVAPLIESKLQSQKLNAALANVNTSAGVWLDPQYFASDSGDADTSAKTSAASQGQEEPKTGRNNEEKHD